MTWAPKYCERCGGIWESMVGCTNERCPLPPEKLDLSSIDDERRNTIEVARTIIVDFDGTISQYEGYKGEGIYGKPIPEAVETLKELKSLGYNLMVFTARGWIEWARLKNYMDTHKIPYDSIVCGKPVGVAYIDDRSTGRGGDWGQVRKDLGLDK